MKNIFKILSIAGALTCAVAGAGVGGYFIHDSIQNKEQMQSVDEKHNYNVDLSGIDALGELKFINVNDGQLILGVNGIWKINKFGELSQIYKIGVWNDFVKVKNGYLFTMSNIGGLLFYNENTGEFVDTFNEAFVQFKKDVLKFKDFVILFQNDSTGSIVLFNETTNKFKVFNNIDLSSIYQISSYMGSSLCSFEYDDKLIFNSNVNVQGIYLFDYKNETIEFFKISDSSFINFNSPKFINNYIVFSSDGYTFNYFAYFNLKTKDYGSFMANSEFYSFDIFNDKVYYSLSDSTVKCYDLLLKDESSDFVTFEDSQYIYRIEALSTGLIALVYTNSGEYEFYYVDFINKTQHKLSYINENTVSASKHDWSYVFSELFIDINDEFILLKTDYRICLLNLKEYSVTVSDCYCSFGKILSYLETNSGCVFIDSKSVYYYDKLTNKVFSAYYSYDIDKTAKLLEKDNKIYLVTSDGLSYLVKTDDSGVTLLLESYNFNA